MVCMPVLKEEKGGGREIDRLMIIILLVVAKKKRSPVEVSKLRGPGLIEVVFICILSLGSILLLSACVWEVQHIGKYKVM